MITQADKVVAKTVSKQHRHVTNITRMLDEDRIADTRALLGKDLAKWLVKRDNYISEIKGVCRANCIDYKELDEFLKGEMKND